MVEVDTGVHARTFVAIAVCLRNESDVAPVAVVALADVLVYDGCLLPSYCSNDSGKEEKQAGITAMSSFVFQFLFI